jgi:hypothetical protein
MRSKTVVMIGLVLCCVAPLLLNVAQGDAIFYRWCDPGQPRAIECQQTLAVKHVDSASFVEKLLLFGTSGVCKQA